MNKETRYYVMQIETTVTGRRVWGILFEMNSRSAAELFIAQNPGSNLRIETIG